MQVVVWIVIILLALLLIWLLRKWIRRLIFILILLVLAFFIYGIFNPSGASRLWYNVRTFPQRVTSRISDKKEFLDYDSYKLDLSDIGEKITGNDDTSSVENLDAEVENNIQKSEENKEDKKDDEVEEKTIHSFSGLAPQFVEIQQPTKKVESKSKGKDGYSKNDLVGIIGDYVEKNLDDDTDILVTVEYTEDVSNPDKIILETQPKSNDNCHTSSASRVLLKNLFGGLRKSKSETVKLISENEEESQEFDEVEEIKEVDEIEEIELKHEDEAYWVVDDNPIVIEGQEEKSVEVTDSVPTTQKTYNGLTQSEIREAEQIFGILF